MQRTINFMGVLNDDDDEQDEEDPSANHRVDGGESEQFWTSVSMVPRRIWGKRVRK